MSPANESAKRAREFRHDDRAIDVALWRERLRVFHERNVRPHADASVAPDLGFDLAPMPYLVTDPDGVITRANQAAGVLFRRRPEHLSGKPLAAFLPTTERSEFLKRLDLLRADVELTAVVKFALETHGVLSSVVNATVGFVRDKDQHVLELRWVLVSASEKFDREAMASAVEAELERRVEARTRQLEKSLSESAALLAEAEAARRHAEAANREKTELITRVSHELRTPLSAIGGYVELLSLGVHGELTGRQALDVARVKTAHAHILALLDDLLSYFRLGTGQLHVDVQLVHVADALSEVLSMVTPQAEAHGVRCSCRAGEQDAIVRADPERLRQIIVNLLANAIKFTPRGGAVELTWTIEDRHVNIAVHDDGFGIPLDRQEAIFEPFVQLSTARGSAGGGFGLGLAISRGLANAMSGTLTVTSAPGHGSTFNLRLPRGFI